ncbi:uncharacterized protein VDAG_08597 [Verticillium dahliae VdLs.17]|uniref:Uncharacterized protein n=1 Tax=Verticillium dahliae (strain VdLs.17 / ATCC MYA-4575 / FGSC 10137) TaxID=498257 RepID=G2XEL2_VERDV|nr:uncharacterized protein VDAG_08597 [Verticillium dahliae VdLs.17]EGY18263.1 hypothetical protein VDAG_08597 [Verticillium dahliae VdLs.17]KAG7100694.1 hypothetical protein HYQ44_020046 [Verticillium longisporum]KAH6686087.1 hypothetical protein EV126DRAFT_487041 [Verticillium dahliae]
MAAQVESGIATALVTRRSSSTTARQGIGRLILLERRHGQAEAALAYPLATTRYSATTTQRSARHLPNCPPQGGARSAQQAAKDAPSRTPTIIHHHPPSPTSRSSGQRFLRRFLSFPPLPVNGAQAQPAARHWGQRHNPSHNDNPFMNLSPSVDTRLPPAACRLPTLGYGAMRAECGGSIFAFGCFLGYLPSSLQNFI